VLASTGRLNPLPSIFEFPNASALNLCGQLWDFKIERQFMHRCGCSHAARGRRCRVHPDNRPSMKTDPKSDRGPETLPGARLKLGKQLAVLPEHRRRAGKLLRNLRGSSSVASRRWRCPSPPVEAGRNSEPYLVVHRHFLAARKSAVSFTSVILSRRSAKAFRAISRVWSFFSISNADKRLLKTNDSAHCARAT
jgi:hypothetical protein